MTTRVAIAGGAAALALAAGGFVAADQLDIVPLSATETTTVTAAPPTCEAITARGTVADACNQELLLWQQSNRNALSTLPYYAKWKAANPREYAAMRTWGTSPATTPEHTANTAFGALVRYGLNQCRTWAPSLSACLLP